MAFGKNKRMSKGKKGGKKKAGDPFLRKEWYDLKAPASFTNRTFGQTLVSKTQGTKIAADGLRGRIFEVSLGDLNQDSEDIAFKKMRLCCEEIQGRQCLTDFHGMSFTRDKLCSLVKKWHTLIEAFADIKTSDGYYMRLFCIAFTDKKSNQTKTTSYARSSKIRQIRLKMIQTIKAECEATDQRALVKKLVAGVIGKKIQKLCEKIYPLRDVFIKKVKILKKPKLDLARLAEVHEFKGAEAEGEATNAEATWEGEGDGAKNLLDDAKKDKPAA